MQQSLQRVEQLLEETGQIMEHMALDESGNQQQAEQIREALRQERNNVSEMIHQGSGDQLALFPSIVQSIDEIRHQLEGLQSTVDSSYQQSTNWNTESFEALSIDEQQQQAQAYHDKIDYKSIVKAIENLNAASEQLSQH